MNGSQNALPPNGLANCSGWCGNTTLTSNATTADTRRKPIAAAAMRSAILRSVRSDKRLRQPHRLGIGERLIHFSERVRPRADRAPRHGGVMRVEQAQRAHEVRHLAAPASADLQVLAIDLLVHVDRARP